MPGLWLPGTRYYRVYFSSQPSGSAVDVPFWAEEVSGRDPTATFFPCGTQRLACKKLPMGTPLSRQWGLGARLSVEVLYCFAPNSLPPLGQTLLPPSTWSPWQFSWLILPVLAPRTAFGLELMVLLRISWKD